MSKKPRKPLNQDLKQLKVLLEHCQLHWTGVKRSAESVLTDQVTNILCKSGDVIIFDANLIHVGTINTKDNNLRIQLKVTHKDDIPYLSYYHDK